MKFLVLQTPEEIQVTVEAQAYVNDDKGLKLYDGSSNLLAHFPTYHRLLIQREGTTTAEAEESK